MPISDTVRSAMRYWLADAPTPHTPLLGVLDVDCETMDAGLQINHTITEEVSFRDCACI